MSKYIPNPEGEEDKLPFSLILTIFMRWIMEEVLSFSSKRAGCHLNMFDSFHYNIS